MSEQPRIQTIYTTIKFTWILCVATPHTGFTARQLCLSRPTRATQVDELEGLLGFMPQRVAAVLSIKTARWRIVTKSTPMTPALAVVLIRLFRTSPLG